MRFLANWFARLLFAPALAGGFIGAVWIGQALWPQAPAPKLLPEPLQKYLGRKYYPDPTEADPRTKSGPSLEQTISAMGENRPSEVLDNDDPR